MAKTVGQMWNAYASRTPVERWTSRVSLLVGIAIGWLLIAVVCAAIVWLGVQVFDYLT